MKLRHWLGAVAGAVALGAFSMGAQAAPLGSTAAGVHAGSSVDSLVQDVARRCWRHRGHLHCRGDSRRHYYSDPYYYGPGFSFYYGGGQRHGRHHRRHHH